MTTSSIQTLHTREILDSHGNPTIKVDIKLEDDATGRAVVLHGLENGFSYAFPGCAEG
ncbi:hypothetical protein [Nitrosomonas sp.]|uniref:hypothetical protein n=1 Tax=Nitrosomonas sp. TaxID=42353 RepID=UPI003305BBFD